MIKILPIGVIGLLLFSFCATDTYAKHRRSRSYQTPDNFVHVFLFYQSGKRGLQASIVRQLVFYREYGLCKF